MSETLEKYVECIHASHSKDFSVVNNVCPCEHNHKGEFSRFYAKSNTFINVSLLEKLIFCIGQLETIFNNSDFQKRVSPNFIGQANGGVLMSYDFHIVHDQPKLIEVNVNAGGSFIAHQLAQNSQCCCANNHPTDVTKFEQKIVDMFKNEYAIKGKEKDLKTIVILDENPESQFLYPDFILCKNILENHGIRTIILDPSKLILKEEKVMYEGTEIDLIYNRLTDFYFESPQHQHLKEIFAKKLAVITPSPHDHGVYAQKSSLALMGDKDFISQFIPVDKLEQLQTFLLSTYSLQKTDTQSLWERRKNFFFKPLGSFGSKGAYHGAGITKKVWEAIKASPYIAQEFAPAGKRVTINQEFKYDLRVYTYQGDILLITARLYQGQTTNFRTEGGGFSAVLML